MLCVQTDSLGLYKGGEELRRAVAALAGPSTEHREVVPYMLHAESWMHMIDLYFL